MINSGLGMPHETCHNRAAVGIAATLGAVLMLTAQVALAAISTSALVYGALTVASANVKRAIASRSRKVGGIIFLRIGAHQISYCRPRPAPAIKAERMALATKRAQSKAQARLDAIALAWTEGK